MDPLEIKKNGDIAKPTEQDKKTLERGFSHAINILKNMNDLTVLPGENFATAMKRIWNKASAEMMEKAAQDKRNEAAQAAFEKANNKKSLDEGTKAK